MWRCVPCLVARCCSCCQCGGAMACLWLVFSICVVALTDPRDITGPFWKWTLSNTGWTEVDQLPQVEAMFRGHSAAGFPMRESTTWRENWKSCRYLIGQLHSVVTDVVWGSVKRMSLKVLTSRTSLWTDGSQELQSGPCPCPVLRALPAAGEQMLFPQQLNLHFHSRGSLLWIMSQELGMVILND